MDIERILADLQRQINDLASSRLTKQGIVPGVIQPQDLAVNNTPNSGDLYYSNGTNFIPLAAGLTNQVLTSNADKTLSWKTPSTTNPDPLIADALNARTTNHITITPGTSKLVKTALLRQDIAANSYTNNVVTIGGWTYVQGDGVASYGNATATFGVTFLAAPLVIASCLGVKSGSDPTVITDFGTSAGGYFATAFGVLTTATNLQYAKNDGTAVATTDRVGIGWIAIGQI